MKAFRFKAFMSYSHADEPWAAWLHKALETYRVPSRLVGTTNRHGEVPARLAPIFRDRDELSSAVDLSGKIKDALADSETLVVICSPAAARSNWVNEEIRYFRSLGRKRIYSVIVDGDPHASDPQRACFPPALLEHENNRQLEPLAADVRKWADGKTLAKLKLAASILGVRLDELRQREQQRKRKMQLATGVAVLAVVALLLFSLQSRVAEREARLAQEAQQASAESMLAQFLEQSERLGDVADLETLKAFGEVMSSYLGELDPADLTLESRRQLGVALTNRGVILRAEGHLAQAMEAFQRAQQTLQMLVDDSQGDQDALFELSQSEYWIGQVHLDLGRMEEAGEWFKAYAEVSDTLHRMQPGNADWTMEAAYAQSNLGNLEKRKIPSDPHLALQYYASALVLNQEAARLDGAFERELADSHADLADALQGVCDLAGAMEQRFMNIELADRHYRLNPASNRLKEDYANALSGLFWVQQQRGDLGQAMENLGKSLDLHSELVEQDPSNLRKRWDLLIKSAYQAQLLHLSGKYDESRGLSEEIEKSFRELMDQDQDFQIEHAIEHGVFLRDFAYRAFQRGESAIAGRLLEDSIRQLAGIAARHPDNRRVLNELARSYYNQWIRNGGTLADDSAAAWIGRIRKSSNIQACSDLNIAARVSVMGDDPDQARIYVSRLIERGYREPEFIKFCNDHGLCKIQADQQ